MNFSLIQKYYRSKEYHKKVKDRVDNLQELSVDILGRNNLMRELYSNDFKRYCEDFLFLIIPEYADAIKPFFLFDYQESHLHICSNLFVCHTYFFGLQLINNLVS